MKIFNNDIKKILKEAPNKPGVYIMKDYTGKIIYIGKAKNLKKRVSQYFFKNTMYKQRLLSKHIHNIEFLLSSDETDALILENNLIKKYKPQYNILLKDDKTYPYLCLDMNSLFPTLEIVRSIKEQKGILYFGPFPAMGKIRKAKTLLIKIFRLRPCKKMKKKKCLYSQIGKCDGFCEQNGENDQYLKRIERLKRLLLESSPESVKKYDGLMKTCAKSLDFEGAAYYRDLIYALRLLWGKSEVESVKRYDTDYICFKITKKYCFFMLLAKRSGKINKFNFYPLILNSWEYEQDIMMNAILQYYKNLRDIPERIYIQDISSDFYNRLEEVIKRVFGKTIKIIKRKNPQIQKHISLLNRNIEYRTEKFLSEYKKKSFILEDIKELFNLKKAPERIEAYDISNLGGTLAVASMVVFIDGRPSKKEYRKFKIKTVIGQDDFSMLREVIKRRAGHLEWGIPDILLIDGGKGQLSSVNKELEAIKKLYHPFIMSIAKKEELLFTNNFNKPLKLPHTDERLRLFVYLRDEAHRFALGYQRKRRKENYKSILDDIPGLGKKRKEKLFAYYSNIAGLKRAGLEELENIDGISTKLAKKIYDKLKIL